MTDKRQPVEEVLRRVVREELAGRVVLGADRAQPKAGTVPNDHLRRVPPERVTWFCPGCGVELAGVDLACASCKISFRPLVYQLVEHHPHPHGCGGYY